MIIYSNQEGSLYVNRDIKIESFKKGNSVQWTENGIAIFNNLSFVARLSFVVVGNGKKILQHILGLLP